jgi:quercetin dioxygenase-like cupin family protein
MKNDKEQKNIGKDLSEAVRLVNLVEYKEDSVVSRMLLNKKSGTVTLFAFDDGQGLSEHTAPFDALVHILDCEAEITISGRKLLLRKVK